MAVAILSLASLFLLPLRSTHAVNAQTSDLDVVIANGHVMDPESGLDAVRNIGIRAGKIVEISGSPLHGKETIDAKGLVVAPGFIDLHQHGQDPENYDLKAADGVTTALEMELGTADVDAWYNAHAGKARINYGVSVGHVPVRIVVMHEKAEFVPSGDAAHRAATPAEIEEMKQMLDRGLRQGALGVGMGTAYTFGATNWEIVQMFQVAASHHSPVYVHIRSLPTDKEGDLVGFEEVFASAVDTGAPLHIVHLQSTGGPNVNHELEMIAAAQKRGIDITAEAYPYSRGMTDISSAIFDHKENEPDTYYASLLWPTTGEMLTKEKFLANRKTGGMVILPSNTEENVHAAVASPLTMIASDGRVKNGKGHPRTAGTYSKILADYVRKEHAFDLMTAMRKMSLMPAQRLQGLAPMFKDKGRIRVGADADIVVFDPATVQDHADYANPAVPSTGFAFVLVDGVPVIRNAKLVDNATPGRPARAPIQQ